MNLAPPSAVTGLAGIRCHVLALGPELTIAYAQACREQLLQALDQHADGLCLDLAQVTDFDSAGVQLLLATANSLRQRGQQLQVNTASTAVQEGLAVFGLQHLLEPAAAAR